MRTYKLPYNMPKNRLNELIRSGMESERGCDGCKHEENEHNEAPCRHCRRLYGDWYEEVVKE